MHPDKFSQNGMAVAQLIWREKFLTEHKIGPYVDVVDEAESGTDDDGIEVERRKVRKVFRNEVGDDTKKLFSGTQTNIHTICVSNLTIYR